MLNNIGIVVLSCDKYYDLWNPFFYFFEKYWADCPYPIYLATNSRIYLRNNIKQIHSNKFTTWSDETFTILEKYPHDYLIYFQDDYLLTKKVDTSIIDSLFKKMILYNADYLRLFPLPGPDHSFKNETEIGIINKNAPYRTSTQCAIWKKNTFLSLLQKCETNWDFEINSPSRSNDYLFLSVVKHTKDHISTHTYPITYYHKTAVFKGKWMPEVIKMCREEGLQIDTNYRKVETNFERLYGTLYAASPKTLQHVYDFISNKYKTLLTKRIH